MVEVAWNQVSARLSPPDVEKLVSELETLKQLQHPHILSVLSAWVDSQRDSVNFTSEKTPVSSLADRLQQTKKADMNAVKTWCRQILASIDYLHSHEPPVLHRDIKCSNIFLKEGSGDLKIGLAASSLDLLDSSPLKLHNGRFPQNKDISAFGICVAGMISLDSECIDCANPEQFSSELSQSNEPAFLEKIEDSQARAFVSRCLWDQAVTAKDLMSDPFVKEANTESSNVSMEALEGPMSELDVSSGPVGQTSEAKKPLTVQTPLKGSFRLASKPHHRRNASEPPNFVPPQPQPPPPPMQAKPSPRFHHRRNVSDPSAFSQMTGFPQSPMYYEVPQMYGPPIIVSGPHHYGMQQQPNGPIISPYSDPQLMALGHPSPPPPPPLPAPPSSSFMVPMHYSDMPPPPPAPMMPQVPYPVHVQLISVPHPQQYAIPPGPPPAVHSVPASQPSPSHRSRPMPTNRQQGTGRHQRHPTFTSSPLEPTDSLRPPPPVGGFRRTSSEPFFGNMDPATWEGGQAPRGSHAQASRNNPLPDDILAHVAPERELLGKILQEERKKQETRTQLCHMLEARGERIVPAPHTVPSSTSQGQDS
mmetsp:Transcript_445/g.763  ORF Transcript_445/g.763 Transcript_445/m.763 type:complete len:589 (+) Transcript_445:357-2123(+)